MFLSWPHVPSSRRVVYFSLLSSRSTLSKLGKKLQIANPRLLEARDFEPAYRAMRHLKNSTILGLFWCSFRLTSNRGARIVDRGLDLNFSTIWRMSIQPEHYLRHPTAGIGARSVSGQTLYSKYLRCSYWALPARRLLLGHL